MPRGCRLIYDPYVRETTLGGTVDHRRAVRWLSRPYRDPLAKRTLRAPGITSWSPGFENVAAVGCFCQAAFPGQSIICSPIWDRQTGNVLMQEADDCVSDDYRLLISSGPAAGFMTFRVPRTVLVYRPLTKLIRGTFGNNNIPFSATARLATVVDNCDVELPPRPPFPKALFDVRVVASDFFVTMTWWSQPFDTDSPFYARLDLSAFVFDITPEFVPFSAASFQGRDQSRSFISSSSGLCRATAENTTVWPLREVRQIPVHNNLADVRDAFPILLNPPFGGSPMRVECGNLSIETRDNPDRYLYEVPQSPGCDCPSWSFPSGRLKRY
jgi:hypothetical protein